jgi:hypothetical protein
MANAALQNVPAAKLIKNLKCGPAENRNIDAIDMGKGVEFRVCGRIFKNIFILRATFLLR